ncbi:MAG: MarC family protein [Candidatus Contendobacter sp.]|nr:MarC family protein [Candidatus Contendobacter sp.]MDS4057515.1 MarC family protein [Candidatus Contendobacter sp.]
MLDQLVTLFVTLLVVIDPVGVAPMFAALTRGGTDRYRRRMALKGTAIATLIMLFFLFTGDALLRFLGISLAAFRVSGGALLFLLAIDMVFARPSGLRSTTVREQEEAQYKEDISVFPLAFPLLAGPGALTTILLTTSGLRPQDQPLLFLGLLGVLLAVLALTLACLLLAPRLMRLLGETGANVIDRLLGVILAALAMQYMLEGLRAGLFGP